MTDVLPPTPDGIGRAAALLADGAVVAFPTDTVYGVGIAGARPDRLGALFELKARPVDRRIPMLVAELEGAIAGGGVADDRVSRLAERLWPGPLTLVLPMSSGETQAFRVPDHPVALALIRQAGPIYTTSANISDQIDTLGADEVLIAFAERRDQLAAVVDGGRVPGGRASTVLDLSVTPARVLRPGPISPEQLAEIVELAP